MTLKDPTVVLLVFLLMGTIFYASEISTKLEMVMNDRIEINISEPEFGETIYGNEVRVSFTFSNYWNQHCTYLRYVFEKDGVVVYDSLDYVQSIFLFYDYKWIYDKEQDLDGNGEYVLTVYAGFYNLADIENPIVNCESTEFRIVDVDEVSPPVPEILDAYHIMNSHRKTYVVCSDLSHIEDFDHYFVYWGNAEIFMRGKMEFDGTTAVIDFTDDVEPFWVSCTSVDYAGNESAKCYPILVTKYEGEDPDEPDEPPIDENRAPYVSFSTDKNSYEIGEVITCTSSSYDLDGDALEHRWWFDGDEVTSIGDKLAFVVKGTSGRQMQHVFTLTGNHFIRLIVSDGKEDRSTSRTVHVTNTEGDDVVTPTPMPIPSPTPAPDSTTFPQVGDGDVVIEKETSFFGYLRDPLFLMLVIIMVSIAFYRFVLKRKVI